MPLLARPRRLLFFFFFFMPVSIEGHSRSSVRASEMERCSLRGDATDRSKRTLQGDNKTARETEGAHDMKNNRQGLKRQGQKSSPPPPSPPPRSSDMTNTSPLCHQSPGIGRQTRTIDPDASAPEGKHGGDTEMGLCHVWGGGGFM